MIPNISIQLRNKSCLQWSIILKDVELTCWVQKFLCIRTTPNLVTLRKKEAKPHLGRWMLLLQEFDFDVKDRKGCENQVSDHFSHLETNHEKLGDISIDHTFPDKLLM